MGGAYLLLLLLDREWIFNLLDPIGESLLFLVDKL
jgi:hypothetical protein